MTNRCMIEPPQKPLGSAMPKPVPQRLANLPWVPMRYFPGWDMRRERPSSEAQDRHAMKDKTMNAGQPDAPGHRLCRVYPQPWPQRLKMAAQIGEPHSAERIKAINTSVLQMHLAGLCERPASAGVERGKWGLP